MNAKISVFDICAEGTISLLLYNLHDRTFKDLCMFIFSRKNLIMKIKMFLDFLLLSLQIILAHSFPMHPFSTP